MFGISFLRLWASFTDDDDLDDEEVAEDDQHIPERDGKVVVGKVVSAVEPKEASILLKPNAQGEH